MALRDNLFAVKETKLIKRPPSVVKSLQGSYFIQVPGRPVTLMQYRNPLSWKVGYVSEIVF